MAWPVRNYLPGGSGKREQFNHLTIQSFFASSHKASISARLIS